MKIFQDFLAACDRAQQRHRWSAFVTAVIKKYSDDQAGNQAALLTYYSFLSLFPLLLILATVTRMVVVNNEELQKQIIDAATSYFPVLGDQLYGHINSLHTTGLPLLIGLLFLIYGVQGVARAYRQAVNKIWGIKRAEQDTFVRATLKNLVIIGVGGIGFIAAAICAGFAANSGASPGFRLLSLAANLFILFWLFNFLLKVALARSVTLRDTWIGAAAATVGLVILQYFGTYLLTNHMHNLDAFYSYFALSLGLLFWIYLQAQVLLYAIEIATVRNKKLYPRSLIK